MKIRFPHGILVLFLVLSCSEEISPEFTPDKIIQNPDPIADAVSEGFEGASKSSYSTATITLGTGAWKLTDAMIGKTPADRKYKEHSVRIINNGILSMEFDLPSAETIYVHHAVHGEDGPSSWQLWMSLNSGVSYALVEEVTSNQTELTRVSFSVEVEQAVRFQIRKTSGGINRINIDDIEIVTYDEIPDPDPDPEPGVDNSHILMGNPSGATSEVSNEENYLMNKTYFMLSYSKSRVIPNWVSWHLDANDVGETQRLDNYRPDTALPAGWYRATDNSYSGTGSVYNRGHNCPSGDRTSSREANDATFWMTNIIPQAADNNQKTWAALEDYSRDLMEDGNELYIIMGSYGSLTTIDAGKITVPERIWKVIVVLPVGNGDLSRVTAATRVIAIDTPNRSGADITTNWRQFRVSVDAIEAATGYDLLSALPDSIENTLEAQVDSN